jgi:hypothetical protein
MSTAATPVEALERVARLASDGGASQVARDAAALSERLREGRFHLACFGQFKRGKSTLINALVGEELLPVGVAPVTSVVTVVRFGAPRVRVRVGRDGWRDIPKERLSEFVSEALNPENEKERQAPRKIEPGKWPAGLGGRALRSAGVVAELHLSAVREPRGRPDRS